MRLKWWAFLCGICAVAMVQAEDTVGHFETTGEGEIRHTSTDLDVKVVGLTAELEYTQYFINDSDKTINGLYVFPLSDHAAVHAVSFRIGQRLIEAKIQPKKQAKAQFEQAKKQGKAAILTQQHRPNVFSQRLANIPPGKTVAIKLIMTQPADYSRGRFELRLPTKITARYQPASKSFTAPRAMTDWVSWSQRLLPSDQLLKVNINIDPGFELADASLLFLPYTISRKGSAYQLAPKQYRIAMDRDLVVQWQPEPSAMPRLSAFSEVRDGYQYTSALVIPPTINDAPTQARDILFVLDVSGSMGGEAIRQLKEGMKNAFRFLDRSDRVALMAFNHQYWNWHSGFVAATSANLQQANHWVTSLVAKGGTEMLPALSNAHAQFRDNPSERVKQLVFITDGAVSNDRELISAIAADQLGIRVFTVGVGAAPNSYFMNKAAEIGHGVSYQVDSMNRVAATIDELSRHLDQVVMSDIDLDWGMDVEMYPAALPDLYEDEAVWVSAKSQIPLQQVVLKHRQVELTQASVQSEHVGQARLWASRRIAAVNDDILLNGASPSRVDEITRLGMAHQLLTRYTSFIAIDHNLSPSKATFAAVQLPNTATDMVFWQRVAVASLLLAMTVLICQAFRKDNV